MTTAPQILHAVFGSPALDGFSATRGRCRICDCESERTMPFRAWLPPTATDWDLWHGLDGKRGAGLVCEPCAWVRSGKPGDDNCLRLQAHIWASTGAYLRPHKSARDAIRAAILACLRLPNGARWFAAVPDSGKKHVVPRAPVNIVGRGVSRVAFETEIATLTVADGRWMCLDAVATAMEAGASKTSILDGRWHPAWLRKISRATLRDIEASLKPFRGSVELELAVHLAKQQERVCQTVKPVEIAEDVRPAPVSAPEPIPAPKIISLAEAGPTNRKTEQLSFGDW